MKPRIAKRERTGRIRVMVDVFVCFHVRPEYLKRTEICSRVYDGRR